MAVCRFILTLLSFVVSLQSAPVPRPEAPLTTTSNPSKLTPLPATNIQTTVPATQSSLPTDVVSSSTVVSEPLITTQVIPSIVSTGFVTTSAVSTTPSPPPPVSIFIQPSPLIDIPQPAGSGSVEPPSSSTGPPLISFGELTIPSQGGTFDDFMVSINSDTTEVDTKSKLVSENRNSKQTSQTKEKRFFPSIFDSEYSPDRFNVQSGLLKNPFGGKSPVLPPPDAFKNVGFSGPPNEGLPDGSPPLEGNENRQPTEDDSQDDPPAVPFGPNAFDKGNGLPVPDPDDTDSKDD